MQDFIGHRNPTVSIDLDDVFASEGLRRAHGSDHNFVEDLILIWIHDMAVVEGMASHAGQVFTLEDFLCDFKAIRSA